MKDALKVYGPLAVAILILLIITMRFVAPPPPMELRFAAGGVDGQYYALAQRYADALSRHGIDVEVLETRGTMENYALLNAGEADVALLQGGLADDESRANLESLGGMFAEPFWIFTRADQLSLLSSDFGDLETVRIAGGAEGSGTRAMTERLQAEWGGTWLEIVPLSGSDAATALLAGEVEAAVFTASVNASYVQTLLTHPNARLIGMRRAKGLSMRDDALAPLTLYDGVVDMDRDIPAGDVELISAIAQLGVDKDLHPALQSVLLEAAESIHNGGSILTRADTFPDATRTDLPLSEEARRYYRNGPTFLRRYFSFGWANFLERAWVFLIPLVALLIPLVQMAPPVYRWRIRRKIYVWYNDLHDLERRGFEAKDDETRRDVLADILALQHEVGRVEVPVSYNDELYHLRSHINFVEALIARQAAQG
ncbi:MAG: ABC transporter substrate-binding protein [Hyphomonadaceae bacterium]|nr:ABC transporter substrate-binding protein [Hyphomonadaceae bacterium]